jgi:urease accessory protein
MSGPASAAVRLLGLDPLAVNAVSSPCPWTTSPPGRCAPPPAAGELPAAAHPSSTSWPRPTSGTTGAGASLCQLTTPTTTTRRTRTAAPVRIGIGGPVGSGKTALVAALARALTPRLRLAVVTNDIYTTEDAEFLRRAGVLAPDRIEAVQTGCCPHTAIRDDITANLEAVELLEERFGDLDLVLVESGRGQPHGRVQPRAGRPADLRRRRGRRGQGAAQGRPGVTTADLLVINKEDLAPLVGADMAVMTADAHRVRQGRPVVVQSLVADPGATDVAQWVLAQVAELAVHR